MISVVIPSRNRHRMLRRAIDSVLAQTYRDLEVIVVDDGSGDDTGRVAARYADERVRYTRHARPRGPSAARNTGIGLANGDIIAFLDDDDEWLPEKLARQADYFERPDSAPVVFTACCLVDSYSGRIIGERRPEKRGRIYHDLLRGNMAGATSSFAVRKECFEKAGLFDESMQRYQDLDMYIRLARHYAFDYIDETLVRYHVHGDGRLSDDIGDAVAALQRIESKYYEDISADRVTHSTFYVRQGRLYIRDRRSGEARRCFRRAVRISPGDPRNYAYYAAAFLGSSGFHLLEEAAIYLRHRGQDSLRDSGTRRGLTPVPR